MKMRDSGIPWLGELPAHWDLWKVGHLARVGNGSTPERDNTEYWTDGSLPWLNSSVVNQAEVTTAEQFVTELARKECHLPLLHPGTVLIAITGQGKTRGQAVVLSIEATINQHMAFVAPNPALIAPWFLRWSFYRAYEYLRSISDDAGGTKGALTCEDVASLKIPMPPLEEQRAIVTRLAHETARLDALLAAKQRLLDLLAEKRKAIIATAVTRGLDPKVKLRDSGVPWLGEIPEHWESKRMKYLFRLVADKAPVDNDFELLSLYTDVGVKPRRELEERGNKASSTDEYWLVQPGDLVVNKLLAWMGAFGVSEYCGVTSPAYDILRPHEGVESFFYHHLFRCGVATTEVRARSYGIMDMRLRLYFDRLGDMYVPVPPHDEQRAIVAHIARETAKLDAVRAATERTIALLKERRAALIAAAVTGQLDVETAA